MRWWHLPVALALFAAGWFGRSASGVSGGQRAAGSVASREFTDGPPSGSSAAHGAPGVPPPGSAGIDRRSAGQASFASLCGLFEKADDSDSVYGPETVAAFRALDGLSAEVMVAMLREAREAPASLAGADTARDALVARLADLDPERLIDEELKRGQQNEEADVYAQALITLAQRDPAAAKARLEAMRTTIDDWATAFTGYVTGLARKDPLRALELVEAEPGSNDDAKEIIHSEWARRAPQEFLDYAARGHLTLAHNESTGEAFDRWLGRDADAAWTWLKALPEDQAQSGWEMALRHQKDADTTAAANRLLERPSVVGESDSPGAKLAFDIAKSYTELHEDPQAWLDRFPADANRGPLYAGVASAMARKDAVAASEWIAKLPRGAEFDAAAQSLVVELGSSDPERGLQWAGAISNPGMAQASMGRVYRRWMVADPVAAQASLNQLPPEKQAAVLEAMRNSPGRGR